MPEEEKKKTKTELGKEKRLAERADRKAASDARKAKTAEKQAAVDDVIKYGTQRQIETSARMDRREFNSGLYLRGNDPMAGRRKPIQQVGTKGGGIDFTSTQINASGGGSGGSHAFKMRFYLDDNDNPVVSLDQRATNVYIRGTNNYYAPDASLQDGANPTGKPSNINLEIGLDSNQLNYIYLVATYNAANSTQPDTFEIVNSDEKEELAEIAIDDSGETDVEYQSKSRVLIGTIELDSGNKLYGSGLTQNVTTTLSAELFVVSSAVVYLITP